MATRSTLFVATFIYLSRQVLATSIIHPRTCSSGHDKPTMAEQLSRCSDGVSDLLTMKKLEALLVRSSSQYL